MKRRRHMVMMGDQQRQRRRQQSTPASSSDGVNPTSRRRRRRPSSSSSAAADDAEDFARQLVSDMSLAAKIGQMTQIDVSQILIRDDSNSSKYDNGTTTPPTTTTPTMQPDLDKIRYYFGQLGIGSVLNCPDPVGNGTQWNASEYRSVVMAIRNVTDEYDRPPVIWGLDSVHGANYVKHAILTPQQINVAASFNVTVAYEAGRMASKDTRAAGINWIFAPILGLALQPSWSRVYETFGEDPILVSTMGVHLIRGIQDDDPHNDDAAGGGITPSKAAACAKHFVGYSMPRTGHDRSPAWIPRRHLYQYFVQPWREAIRPPVEGDAQLGAAGGVGGREGGGGGVLTVMESYSETDGVPNVANYETTQKLLRDDLGFDGVLVTDYHEILNLVDWHRVAADGNEAVKWTLKESSVDMSMVPIDVEGFVDQVRAAVGVVDSTTLTDEDEDVDVSAGYPPLPRAIDMNRINESAERVVKLKALLGMFDERVTMDSPLIKTVGSQEDRAAALEMARQGIVLVENRNSTLPIPSSPGGGASMKVHVTGPTSTSLSYQTGGWTVNWQGSPSDSCFTYGTTVVQAANDVPTWDVTTSCGVSILGEECKDEDGASPDEIASSDYVIVCIGEENYTEKPGDIRDLRLAQGQIDFVQKVKAKSSGKIVLVYFGGRPRLLGDTADHADAVFVAFLPGPDGGQAVVDLITGASNPSGQLPITYPKYPDGGGAPYFSAVSDQCTVGSGPLPHWDSQRCTDQWSFGHGLSYSTFDYSGLTVSSDRIMFTSGKAEKANSVEVSVTIRNSSPLPGSDTVLFFLFDDTRYVTPEYKRLRYFEKIMLQPGEERQVTWHVSLDDLYHVGPHDDSHFVLQEGMKFRVGIGSDTDCRANPSDSLCTSPILLQLPQGDHYVGACDAACRTWVEGDCAACYGMDWDSCWETCTSDAEENYAMHGRHEGWGWNYVECIESVSRGMEREAGVIQTSRNCWKMTVMCRDIFRNGGLNTCGRPSLDSEATKVTVYEVGALIAIVAVMVASSFVLFVVRKGWCSRKQRVSRRKKGNGDVEFTRVPSGKHVSWGE